MKNNDAGAAPAVVNAAAVALLAGAVAVAVEGACAADAAVAVDVNVVVDDDLAGCAHLLMLLLALGLIVPKLLPSSILRLLAHLLLQ